MSELALEVYARLLAHLACRRDVRTEEILAELGISAEGLKQAEAAHREELAAAWTNRSGIMAMRFAAALGKELSTLGPLGGSVVSAGRVAPRGGAPAPPDKPALVPPPPPAGEPEVPSFLQPAPPVPAPGAPLGSTGNLDLSAVVASLQRGPLPFSPFAGAAPISEKPPAEAAPRPLPTGTLMADFNMVKVALDQGPLPFGRQPGPATAPVAPAGEAHGETDFALLPLETYASVTRALARGEPRDETLAKHGVAPDVFDRLAKAWAQRFQREPHLFARFKVLATGSTTAGR